MEKSLMVLCNDSGLYRNDFTLDLWLRVTCLERESDFLYRLSIKDLWIGKFERGKEYN
jgi:hypothetical protein